MAVLIVEALRRGWRVSGAAAARHRTTGGVGGGGAVWDAGGHCGVREEGMPVCKGEVCSRASCLRPCARYNARAGAVHFIFKQHAQAHWWRVAAGLHWGHAHA